jgi:lipopolysaccharide biosynthesis regulator YciM
MHQEAIASMQRAAALSGADLGALGFHVAMAYAGLGDTDEAFRWLETACEERAGFMNLLAVTTGFESVRSDPRFADLLRRMGLAGVSRSQASL